MATMEKRLADLESKQINSDLSRMTTEQLDAHLATLKAGTLEWFRVMLVGIQRRGSRLPLATINKSR